MFSVLVALMSFILECSVFSVLVALMSLILECNLCFCHFSRADEFDIIM